MKRIVLLLVLLASLSGCMERQLSNRTMRLSKTTTDLLYMEVLDNIARTIDNPADMPYFNMPAAGTAQIQQEISATVTPGWGLFAATGAFLFNSLTAAANPLQIDQESWQVSPVPDPDRIVLMHSAYLKAIGQADAEAETVLHDYYSARDGWVAISIGQVDYSNEVWDVWRHLVRIQDTKLSDIKDWDQLTDTEKEVWKSKLFKNPAADEFNPPPSKKFDRFRYEADVRMQLPHDAKQIPVVFLSVRLSYDLQNDGEYRRLKAQFDSLVPPTIAPGTPKVTYGIGGGSSSGGGGASAAGASGGSAAKPPLPIRVPYYSFVEGGWYNVGSKRDVPKDACYVACHCNTYVWVTREQLNGLTRFTLAILDFYNIGNSGGSNIPQPPPATLGR